MYPPFTFNPNMPRASTNYQQQSGMYQQQPMYNIGIQTATSFMSHPSNLFMNHQFTRSFASVVSCENDMAKHQNVGNINKTNIDNRNPGLLSNIFKHFNKPHYLPTATPHKEFDDFTHMPSHYNQNYQSPVESQHQQHYYSQPPTNHINTKNPFISGPTLFQAQQSANNATAATRNFMASLFASYQQRQQPQTPPKPKNQRWFGKGFRCRGGRGRNSNNNSDKFRDHEVNLPKNVHEKDRSSIERDILDDCCDFVHVDKEVASVTSNNPNETAKGSCWMKPKEDPPFMIYSLEEFPAIVSTSGRVPVIETKSPTPSPPKMSRCDEGFVMLPSTAAETTPSFTQKRLSLCEKIIRSPTKLFPKPIPVALKPCLKAPRRSISECSDDFVVFANDSNEMPLEDVTFSDDESETDSDGDDDDDDVEECKEKIKLMEDDETSDEEDDDEMPEQLDSGVEEKRVRFNLTPKVRVMHVWDYASRAIRADLYWQQVARDHERFKKRISSLETTLNPVLDAAHREKIFKLRFMEA